MANKGSNEKLDEKNTEKNHEDKGKIKQLNLNDKNLRK
jgi:hypothetical protein